MVEIKALSLRQLPDHQNLWWIVFYIVVVTLCMCVHCLMCRLNRYQQFKDFQKRILVATNLFGRGMDIERVNIVFNYDMPEDSDTYLHRVSYIITALFYALN